MRRKANWAATALAVGTAMVMVAAPAQARTASGWRINQVFGQAHRLDLQAVAASGAASAALLGLVPNPEPTFVTERWNGQHWGIVKSPSPGSFSTQLVGVAAVSANDVWAVGHADSSTLIEHYHC